MKSGHNNKKRGSVLKDSTNQRLSTVSPSRYSSTLTNQLSSCCHPKQPPNVSQHYLQKKQQQVKFQYYNSGKENKSRGINSQTNHLQTQASSNPNQAPSHANQGTHGTQASTIKDHEVLVDNTDRYQRGEKRNSHQYVGGYEVKYQKMPVNINHNIDAVKTNYETYNHYTKDYKRISNYDTKYETKYIKTITRTNKQNHNKDHHNKDHHYQQQPSKQLYRDPICLKSIKVTKLLSNIEKQKQSKHSKKQRTIKKQFAKKHSILAENSQCSLRCFQKLSMPQNTVQNNNKGTSSRIQINSQSNQEESANNSRVTQLIDKNPSLKLTKSSHKSPRIMSPSAVIKSPKKTDEQLIAQFQKKINQINIDFEYDSLQYSMKKDEIFVRKQNLNKYLDNQLHLDWKKRAMVINWMIEVLAESGGKRETLANAVNVLDRYLSVTHNIPLDHIQCTAVACLLISSKLQDKSLSASYLSETTLNKYSLDQILLEQEKILKKLKYEVNTPTLNSWANRLALHWDIYLENVDFNGFDLIVKNLNMIKFKNSDEISYYNYRWLCQYVDMAIMDIYTLRYQPRMLALAFIYIVLSMRLNLHTSEGIVRIFPNSSQFLLEKSTFNDFFSKFITDSFSHDLHGLMDLLPNIQYGSTFAMLPLKFDLPETVESDKDDEQVHYEHFCSYQTKNEHMLASLYKRNRNVI